MKLFKRSPKNGPEVPPPPPPDLASSASLSTTNTTGTDAPKDKLTTRQRLNNLLRSPKTTPQDAAAPAELSKRDTITMENNASNDNLDLNNNNNTDNNNDNNDNSNKDATSNGAANDSAMDTTAAADTTPSTTTTEAPNNNKPSTIVTSIEIPDFDPDVDMEPVRTPSSGRKASPLPSPSRRLSLTEPPLPVFNLPPNVNIQGELSTDSVTIAYACVSVAGTYLQFSAQQQHVAKYKTNQDSYIISPDMNNNTNTHLFGVLDGHGQVGHFVSQRVASILPQKTVAELNAANSAATAKNPVSLLRVFDRVYDAVENDLLDCDLNVRFSGTTCVTCYLDGKELTVANCGDSRCVLGSRVSGTWVTKDLSNDHKPDLPDEKRRIESMGGRVEPLRTWPDGPKRVWLRHQDLPGLAMSRSFGDSIAHSVGVSHQPEVLQHTLQPQDQIMILASDGVWEFISSQEAIEMAGSMPTPLSAAEMVCQESVDRWAKEEPVCDDITCLVCVITHK